MADVEKTIGGSTPDYATFSLFEAAIPADISLATGTDEHWIAKGRDALFSEKLTISGIVTDSTNRVTLTYDTGAMHDGRARDVSGAGCSISSTTSTGTIVVSGVNHVTIDGIDVVCTREVASGTAVSCSGTFSTDSDVRVVNSILHATGATPPGASYLVEATVANLNFEIINCVGYCRGRAIDTRSSLSAVIDYCTFWLHADNLVVVGSSELTCRNTYAGKVSGSSQDFWSGGTSPSGSNNTSSDTSATIDYAGSQISKAGSNQFVNITAGSEDFTLKSGSDLEGFATPISGITTDIIGTVRDSTAPDGGAFEFVVVSGATGRSNPFYGPLGGPLYGVIG